MNMMTSPSPRMTLAMILACGFKMPQHTGKEPNTIRTMPMIVPIMDPTKSIAIQFSVSASVQVQESPPRMDPSATTIPSFLMLTAMMWEGRYVEVCTTLLSNNFPG